MNHKIDFLSSHRLIFNHNVLQMFNAFEQRLISFYLVFLLFTSVVPRRPPLSAVLKGEKADKNEFPFIVLITSESNVSTYNDYCIGSILARRWIVTAVDCAVNTTDFMNGKVYDKNVTVLPNDDGVLDPENSLFEVEKKFCYPKTTDKSPEEFDKYKRIAALLKLNRPIPLGQGPHNYSAIKIAQPSEVNWVSSRIKVGGWETYQNGSITVHMLRAPLHLFPRKDCEKFGGVWMCSNSSNVCTEDWGAPVIAQSDKGDRLIGISFLGDCSTNTFTLNVTSVNSWITKVMNEEAPEDECRSVYQEDFLKSEKGGSRILRISGNYFFVLTFITLNYL